MSLALLGGQQINTDADHEIGRTEESQDSGKAIAGIRALSKHVCCLHRFHRRNATIFIVNRRSVNTRIIVHIIAGVKWEFAYIKRHTMASISWGLCPKIWHCAVVEAYVFRLNDQKRAEYLNVKM